METRKTTSLKIDPETWKQAKKKCIDKDMHISEYIESLIKKDLKILILIISIALFSSSAFAVIDMLSFEASLFNSDGDPINGNITVEIYDAESAGNLIYNSSNNFVNDDKKRGFGNG